MYKHICAIRYQNMCRAIGVDAGVSIHTRIDACCLHGTFQASCKNMCCVCVAPGTIVTIPEAPMQASESRAWHRVCFWGVLLCAHLLVMGLVGRNTLTLLGVGYSFGLLGYNMFCAHRAQRQV